MKELEPPELVLALQTALKERFPGEEFLSVELQRVISGLVTCVRRSVLRSVREQQEKQSELLEPIEILVTKDHFCNQWMKRGEIIDRIENICGLDKEMSGYALEVIENRIDGYLKADAPVNLHHIGVVEVDQFPSYRIHLTDNLKFKPSQNREVASSAIKFRPYHI